MAEKSSPAALFGLGFRPFYLLAGIYAALAVPLRGLQYTGLVAPTDPLWHAHEMLFGFAFAVIAGFLFTAVRNWTNRATPTGGALAGIAGLWLAARLMALWSLPAAAVLDALFAAAVAWGIGRPLLVSGNRRNLSFSWRWHLALRGLAGFGLVIPSLATHALTAGAIGGLTLGMMTRTARGHTGRPLIAGLMEVAAYALVVAAAVVRVLVPLVLPGAYLVCISASAVLWSAAFVLFAAAYVPILTQPRLDGAPG